MEQDQQMMQALQSGQMIQERYELEKNNGKTLSPEMTKQVLRALEMRIERFGIIKNDFNNYALNINKWMIKIFLYMINIFFS